MVATHCSAWLTSPSMEERWYHVTLRGRESSAEYKLCWNCTRLYSFSHLFVQVVLRWSHLADSELYRISNRAQRRQPVARKNSMNQYQSFSLDILVRLDRFCYSHWNLNSFLEVQAQYKLFWNTWRLTLRITEYCTYFTARGQSYFSRLPRYWAPNPLSARRVCPPPATKAGGTHSPGREGDGGSIFWKTREIGLPSYSKICTLWCVYSTSPLSGRPIILPDYPCKAAEQILLPISIYCLYTVVYTATENHGHL